MNNSAINLMALGGKLVVESTSWNRLQKEGLKASIDVLAEVMKSTRVTEENEFSRPQKILCNRQYMTV